ncbi:MAG: phosphatidylserine decarboxylase family protein [Culturomica sp.]|jgi:phosphatidylserine decarboxylase|nr:phosphatidylserine decarboxylase family protein [Culturomica sp.]
MTLHKAGYSLLIKILLFLIVVNTVLFFAVDSPVVLYTAVAVSGILFLGAVNFFRFPKRRVTLDNNAILAPADGRIVVIEETGENEYLHDRRMQVSIFMNILNVHINWFPVNGVIRYFRHHKGKHLKAYLPKSSTDNERTTIVIECRNGQSVLMRQIAGAVAKRIVSYAPVGGEARQDRHAGFIKFGSRVDLLLPLDTELKVALGEKTTGSQTVIGYLKPVSGR